MNKSRRHESEQKRARFPKLIGLAMLAAFAGVGQAQDALFIDAEGRVGIGTSTPRSALAVSQTTGTEVRMDLDLNGDRWFFANNQGNAFRITRQGQGVIHSLGRYKCWVLTNVPNILPEALHNFLAVDPWAIKKC